MALPGITFTRHEVSVLADFMATQPKSRTYRIIRDERNVLHVLNADNTRFRLTPIYRDRSKA